jgi:hypothetical protein
VDKPIFDVSGSFFVEVGKKNLMGKGIPPIFTNIFPEQRVLPVAESVLKTVTKGSGCSADITLTRRRGMTINDIGHINANAARCLCFYLTILPEDKPGVYGWTEV